MLIGFNWIRFKTLRYILLGEHTILCRTSISRSPNVNHLGNSLCFQDFPIEENINAAGQTSSHCIWFYSDVYQPSKTLHQINSTNITQSICRYSARFINFPQLITLKDRIKIWWEIYYFQFQSSESILLNPQIGRDWIQQSGWKTPPYCHGETQELNIVKAGEIILHNEKRRKINTLSINWWNQSPHYQREDTETQTNRREVQKVGHQ